MKITNILGIDVSKDKLDCHLYLQGKALEEVTNDEKGYRKLCTWLKKFKLEMEQLLVVMEYTGIYTYGLERYLHKERIAFVKRPALDIKRSLGMIRGKTDRADARFISRYGWMRKDELKPMKPVEQNLVVLQNLMTYRDKMVVDRASYQVRIKELQGQMGDGLHDAVINSTEGIMNMLSKEIKSIEKNIHELIEDNKDLHNSFELVTSVVGIGFATAVHFIILTENFTRFENVRKLICYCGVAPFKHESGTSIRGRTRVSPLANKKLKTLLTMAAICAVRFDSGLKAKYHQKVGEGKPKMSVLNIIRAKLIERIFTVVKRGFPMKLG